MTYKEKGRIRGVAAGIVMAAALLVCPITADAAGQTNGQQSTKIHFISLKSGTDSILLESNGHFGMVDSGEDWDYPDGEEYVLRDGVTTEIGFEHQVIHYLKQLGVEKLDFYIATHSHSDHIGSGDEILMHFPTERLYINRYDDSYMLDAHGMDVNDPYYTKNADETHLWDNQYVYDGIIRAANRTGVEIITDLDLEENADKRSFTLGDMNIEIMNYERDRDENGNIIPVVDENYNSLVTKVTAYGQTALLTADMDPIDGDSVKIVSQLLASADDIEAAEETEIHVVDEYEESDYEAENGAPLKLPNEDIIPDEQVGRRAVEQIDESKPNKEANINLDLMKMSHHSIDVNNTTYFLTSMNPQNVVITGYESWYNERERSCMPNAKVYATATDSAAVVGTFNETDVQVEYVKVKPEWDMIDGKWYWFDENGRTFTDRGSHTIGGVEYCFDKTGTIETESRWVETGDVWKYWNAEEERFLRNEWILFWNTWHYLGDDGKMVTGWKQIHNKWYWFDNDGRMQTNTWIDGFYIDEEGVWDPATGASNWMMSGGRWWYQRADGTYLSSMWARIDDEWYYFDKDGWMMTGWLQLGEDWYYLNPNGTMAADTWIGACYVDGSGVWRYAKWVSAGTRWWYQNMDGTYPVSKWQEIDGKKYYFDSEGWMVTGWMWLDEKCYYLNPDGSMAVDTWIGEDYVDTEGVWIPGKARDTWILSGNRWWYRHGDGTYTTSGWEFINGEWYYFDEAGWMVTGWQMVDNNWYYLAENGAMVRSTWVDGYYLKADGAMANG